MPILVGSASSPVVSLILILLLLLAVWVCHFAKPSWLSKLRYPEVRCCANSWMFHSEELESAEEVHEDSHPKY